MRNLRHQAGDASFNVVALLVIAGVGLGVATYAPAYSELLDLKVALRNVGLDAMKLHDDAALHTEGLEAIHRVAPSIVFDEDSDFQIQTVANDPCTLTLRYARKVKVPIFGSERQTTMSANVKVDIKPLK